MLTRIYVVDTAYYTFFAMNELLDGTQVSQIFNNLSLTIVEFLPLSGQVFLTCLHAQLTLCWVTTVYGTSFFKNLPYKWKVLCCFLLIDFSSWHIFCCCSLLAKWTLKPFPLHIPFLLQVMVND